MPEYNFQLRGWHAIVAIVALLGYMGISVALRVRSVDDEMRAAVREQLLKDYSGRSPKDIARIVEEARAGSPIEELKPIIQRDVEFISIAAHGRMGGRVAYVRVEVAVDGGPPPDSRSIRYFSISRKLDGGWMVIGETRSYNYYRELVP